MPIKKRRFLAAFNFRPAVKVLLRPEQTIIHMLQNFVHIHGFIDMKLRRETDLNVTYAFGLIILCEFVGNAFEIFGFLHDSAGIAKGFQIFF
jgi:hypothetical protein